MLENISLPEKLLEYIGSENKDFAVKAGRAYPFKTSLFLILFGSFWLVFTSIFFIAFFGPLLKGREVEFLVNDVPVVAGPGNMGELIVPALVIGLFIIVGLAVLGSGLYLVFKKGGYFVGTPTRLISFNRDNYRSIDWEQFSGDIKVSGSEKKGNITLGMRTGRMVSNKNGPDRYVPDELFISHIPNIHEVEQVCRKRIKENDPTPPVKGYVQ